jgi:hypothetical protein
MDFEVPLIPDAWGRRSGQLGCLVFVDAKSILWTSNGVTQPRKFTARVYRLKLTGGQFV